MSAILYIKINHARMHKSSWQFNLDTTLAWSMQLNCTCQMDIISNYTLSSLSLPQIATLVLSRWLELALTKVEENMLTSF